MLRRSGSKFERRGLMLAGAIAIVGAGIVGYFLVTSDEEPARARVEPQAPPMPPDVAGDIGELGTGEGMHVQFTDELDPSKVTGELRSESIEPLESRRYVVVAPEMWFYQDDGSSLLVRAASGRLYMPSRSQEPESGRLEGGVVVKLFPARSDGSRVTAESAEEKVSVVAETEWLEFDMALGEMSTTELLTIDGEEIDFSGTDVRARFDEVTRSLVLLEVRGGGEIVYDPAARGTLGSFFEERGAKGKPTTRGTPSAPTNPPAAQAPARATRSESKPAEVLYLSEFEDEVVLSQPGRSIEADLLQVWARTVDNKLRDGAIRRIEMARLDGRRKVEPVAAGRLGVLAQAMSLAYGSSQPEADAPPDGAASELVTLRWTGVLRVTPIDEAGELKTDDLAFRFSSVEPGGVRFNDEEMGGEGQASAFAYLATTSQASIEGSAQSPAWISSEEFGRGAFERADADLMNGLVHLGGRVDVAGTGDRGRITCDDGADVALHMEEGALTGLLRETIFNGNVIAGSGESRATGATARAQFEVDRSGEEARATLTHFHIEGDGSAPARLEEGETEYLEGSVIDVALVPGPGADEVDPSRVEVSGAMRGGQGDSTLTAGRLVAELARDEDGDLVATSAQAFEGVHFVNAVEDLEARADEMQSSPAAQQVTFLGASSFVRQATATVFGEQIALDGERGRINAFGPGRFDDREGTGVTASWSREMLFDDKAGRLECHGDVEARIEADALRLDTIKAHRVTADFSARDESAGDGNPLEGSMEGLMGDRQIIGGTAVGSIEEDEAGLPAIVQSIRYELVTGDDGVETRRAVQAMLLEGPRIELVDDGGRLEVPSAGRLVVADERAPESGEARDGGSDVEVGDARGQAMFTWLGSFSLDRDAGEAEMVRGVKGTIREPDVSRVTLLDAERVVARFDEEGKDGGPSLRGATAAGAVYLSQKLEGATAFEVIADELEMDNVRKTAEAEAAPGNIVTVFEGTNPTPATARRFSFDLAKGRWEVRSPGLITSPK